MTRATLIDLSPDKYDQGLHYYPLLVNLEVVIVLMIHLVKYVFQGKNNMLIW